MELLIAVVASMLIGFGLGMVMPILPACIIGGGIGLAIGALVSA